MFFIKNTNNEIWNDFNTVLPISFFLIFFPSFLSFYLFKKDNKISFQIIKPALFSFVIIYIIIYLHFSIIKKDQTFSFFELVSIMNGILAFFLSMFFTIIQIINKNKTFRKNKLNGNIIYKTRYLFAIPVLATIIYIFIIYFNYPNLSKTKIIEIVSKFLLMGITTSFLSFYTLDFIYKNTIGLKRIIYILFTYVVLISLMSIIEILFSYSIIEQKSNSLFAIVIRSIVIRGPFFIFIITITHLYFVHLLNKQEKGFIKQEKLESQLNYQHLKKQLSPHFLFNNINVLTSLIEEDPVKAIKFSESLSNIYRYFLEQEKQDIVLLKDELKFAKDYLHLLECRFEKGLFFELSVSEEDNNKYIVSTSLQQVLENVMKHNEISEENPVFIIISSENDYLSIQNNKNKKTEIIKDIQKGIQNIKKRNSYFSDKEVKIISNKTFYKIQIPLLND